MPWGSPVDSNKWPLEVAIISKYHLWVSAKLSFDSHVSIKLNGVVTDAAHRTAQHLYWYAPFISTFHIVIFLYGPSFENIITGNIPSRNLYYMDFIDALYNEKGLLFRAKSVRAFHKCTAMLQRKKIWLRCRECCFDDGTDVIFTRYKKSSEMKKVAWVPETTRKMRNVLKCIYYVDKSILTWLDRWLTIGLSEYWLSALPLFLSPFHQLSCHIFLLTFPRSRIDLKLHMI